MPEPIVIWGASGHARVLAEIVGSSGAYELVGFVDDQNTQRVGQLIDGTKVLGGREAFEPLRERGVRHCAIGVGDCRTRRRLGLDALAMGFDLPPLVHASAHVAASAALGAGTIVAAQAVVGVGARVGRLTVVNTAASVDHDVQVGEACHICPGVHLAGNVVLGEECWIGIGSCVIQSVRIGARSYLGAGCVVVDDLPADHLCLGHPARPVRGIDHHP